MAHKFQLRKTSQPCLRKLMYCKVASKGFKPDEQLKTVQSGLDGAGFNCLINAEHTSIDTSLVHDAFTRHPICTASLEWQVASIVLFYTHRWTCPIAPAGRSKVEAKHPGNCCFGELG